MNPGALNSVASESRRTQFCGRGTPICGLRTPFCGRAVNLWRQGAKVTTVARFGGFYEPGARFKPGQTHKPASRILLWISLSITKLQLRLASLTIFGTRAAGIEQLGPKSELAGPKSELAARFACSIAENRGRNGLSRPKLVAEVDFGPIWVEN